MKSDDVGVPEKVSYSKQLNEVTDQVSASNEEESNVYQEDRKTGNNHSDKIVDSTNKEQMLRQRADLATLDDPQVIRTPIGNFQIPHDDMIFIGMLKLLL